MKLGTLRDGSRDGRLVVVRRDHRAFAEATGLPPTLQAALDDWDRASGALASLADDLEKGRVSGVPLDTSRFLAPLPRAYEWIDGSAYLSHVLRVRRARGAEPPSNLVSDPLVYQGGSGVLLGPHDPISFDDESFDLDFEGEVCVVLGDTPRATRAEMAHRQIRLLVLANDISLRGLVAAELAKGFGFFLSKPSTAFAPFAVTPDELGPAWRNGRASLSVRCLRNGELIGDIDAGLEMHFSFYDLIAHISRTRSLTAGTLVGGGTVSSSDARRGTACLIERRAIEVLEGGKAVTRYLKPGDTVAIEAFDPQGNSVFGRNRANGGWRVMRLYSYWRSSSSWRVRISLSWKGVPYEYVPVNLAPGKDEQSGAEFDAVNPMHQVPVLEIDEGSEKSPRRIAQSMAILEYLEERFPAPPLLPADLGQRALVRQLCEMVNAGIQPLQNVGVQGYVKRVLMADEMAFARHFVERGLLALERVAAGTCGTFLVGDAVSLADAYLVPQLHAARRWKLDLVLLPTLLRVEAACEALSAFQAARPECQPDAVVTGKA